jgi:hypothetical protein
MLGTVDEDTRRCKTKKKRDVRGDKQNSYKQNGMFLSRPRTICAVKIDFKHTQGCTIDSGTITGEPANLK